MRNLDGRRWEKGASASEMEAFIFLFCWSANVLKVEGEEKKQRNESWAQRGRIISYWPTRWRIFYPWSVPSGYTEPLFIAFIGEDMKELSYAPVNSHFCSQCLLREGKLNLFFDSHLHMHLFFSLCHSRWKHVCDHGQHFPILKCLLLLLLCQFVSEENGSWKTPLFGFALSMETGP